jgi:DNA-binding transcriptional ArsR family regulator
MPRPTKQQTQHVKRQMERRRKTLRPHPMRYQIVDVMRSYGKPISPTQLARITGATLGSIAYHVRTLVSAGIIELAEEGRVRGAVEHFYALVSDNHNGLDDLAQLNDPVEQLLSLCGSLTVPAKDDGLPRPVVIDEAARKEFYDIIMKLKPKVSAIATASTERAR